MLLIYGFCSSEFGFSLLRTDSILARVVGFRSGRCRADTRRARGGVKVWDGAVGVEAFDVESEGYALPTPQH